MCDVNGFVLNTGIIPANLHDSTTFSKGYEDTINKYGVGGEKGIRAIALDAGYKTPAIAREIIKSGVTPLLPYTSLKDPKNNEESAIKGGKKYFKYDKSADVFMGSNKCILTPRRIDRKKWIYYILQQ